jgi:hypothetical protein
MPGFRVWDVVKVPFPCTSRPVRQRRPALVVACHGADPNRHAVASVLSASLHEVRATAEATA